MKFVKPLHPQQPAGLVEWWGDLKGALDAHAYIASLDRIVERRTLIPLTVKAFDRKFAHIDAGGRTVSDRLLADPHRKFAAACFAPGEGPVFFRAGQPCLNTFQGYAHAPYAEAVSDDDVRLFLDMVHNMFGADLAGKTPAEMYAKLDEESCGHFLDYLAFTAQHPGVKIRHAVVLQSNEGLGKGVIQQVFSHIYGEAPAVRAVPIAEASSVDERRAFLIGTKVLVLNEVYASTSRAKRTVHNKLKEIITDTPIRVNEKNIRPYELDNYTSVFIFTNDRHSLHVTMDDRRYFIHEITRPNPGKTFWQPFWQWINHAEGFEKIHRWLRDRDVTHFDPNDAAPVTQAKYEWALAAAEA